MTETATRTVSELEGVALGIVRKRQPCTAYALRKELKASPSSHWRASAGAVYPLLARLQEEGLLRSDPDDDDGRGRRYLRITAKGDRALRSWMTSIVDLDLISEISDPVRSRVFFFDALPNPKQIELTQRLIAELERRLADAQRHLDLRPPGEDLYEHLGAAGAVISAKARVEFLQHVRAQLTRRAAARRGGSNA